MFFFKRPKSKPGDELISTINTLKENIRVIEVREALIEENITKELQIAKQFAQTNKKRALVALKKRKTYEKEIEKLSNARFALEQQMMALEGASLNIETVNSLKVGSKALSKIHKAVNLNTVDDAMENVREQLDIANEISEAISQPMGMVEDEDLNKELEELEQQALEDEMLSMNLDIKVDTKLPPEQKKTSEAEEIKLPQAPTTHIEGEDELEEIRSSLAL